MKKYKFVSWNVNGIRAVMGKGFSEQFLGFGADAVCLQETKAHPDQVDKSLLPSSGYAEAWASAEKKGYSGTALFAKTPLELKDRLGIPAYDGEGRGNIAIYPGFALLNLYFPNGSSSPERHSFKMEFLEQILVYFKKLEKTYGGLIVCGDFNIAHKNIDIHDPVSNKDSSGFLPEERSWMDHLTEQGFVDTFRHVHGEAKDRYSWWSFRQRSRERNKGWRLDYFFVSQNLAKGIQAADILPQVMGSDHCPVTLEIKA